jgi:hypothetical protein
MPKKSKIVSNPFLNAFTYDVAYGLTPEQKRNLNGRYLKYVRNDKTATTFANTADIEERAIFFAKIGMPFAWVFGDLNNDALTEIYHTYKKQGQAKALDKTAEQKVFVVTNREIMRLLGLMASNVHTETYMLNRDFHKAGYHTQNWKKEIVVPHNEAVKEGLHSSRELARILTTTLLSVKDIPAFAGITDCSMAILLFLFSKDSADTLEIDIRAKIQPSFMPSKVTLGLRKLVECQYLERSFRDTKKIAYSITAIGISVAMRFQKRLFDLTYNF